jgi:hypothetical protein
MPRSADTHWLAGTPGPARSPDPGTRPGRPLGDDREAHQSRRHLPVDHLVFLLVVVFLPFATKLVTAAFGYRDPERVAATAYGTHSPADPPARHLPSIQHPRPRRLPHLDRHRTAAARGCGRRLFRCRAVLVIPFREIALLRSQSPK